MTPAVRQLRAEKGVVFAMDQMATHDGPGLRMTVYLKGCPLRCVWCHSPESQRREPEIVWYASRCVQCGACVERCPQQLRSFDPADPFDPETCELCETCVDVCPATAVEVKGYVTTAGEIADQALSQKAFFDASGGGVTLTGGEPTLQPDFVCALLQLLHDAGVHTAIETTGLANWSTLERLIPVTDLFLYDLKHADEELHRRDTGVSNRTILDNLQRLTERGCNVLVRMPCIPGRNGTPEIVTAVAGAARRRGATRISLLPYNPATAGKYAWLKKSCPVGQLSAQTAAEMRELEAAAAATGIEVVPS